MSTKIKSQLGAALLFILLGFGNIIYGNSKSAYYFQLLQQDQTPSVLSPNPDQDGNSLDNNKASANVQSLMFPEVSTDEHARHLKRVTSRLEYYQIAILGGKVFLAFAGVFLLSVLITLRMEERTEGH